MENERKKLLNNLADSIKECRLRFGGKRELATEMDTRVCLLCLQLEALFTFALKPQSDYTNQSTQLIKNKLINNTLLQSKPMNNLKQTSLFKSTNTLISNFFDSNKDQNNDLLNSFWPFVSSFMNRFDIERYEKLREVNTDIGRQRAWLRAALNENCLERYILAIIENTSITRFN
jgi:sorting nexin-29